MRQRFLLASFVALGTAIPGSGCVVSDGPCPTKTVVLDAAPDGLPDVGERGSPEICEELCGPSMRICCRVKALVLSCQMVGCQ